MNSADTENFSYKDIGKIIARSLTFDKTVLVPLDIEESAVHYDILFTIPNVQIGIGLQGGLKMNYLYISIMRKSAFAFRLDLNEPMDKDYIAEKLSLDSRSANVFAEIFNEIKKFYSQGVRHKFREKILTGKEAMSEYAKFVDEKKEK